MASCSEQGEGSALKKRHPKALHMRDKDGGKECFVVRSPGAQMAPEHGTELQQPDLYCKVCNPAGF